MLWYSGIVGISEVLDFEWVFFLKRVSADSKSLVILQLCFLHSEVDGGFLGYGEIIVEIHVIKMGEITLLTSHLAKWNYGAKHPGPHFNPYRDHILGLGPFLILFFVSFAVFKNKFCLFAARCRGHGWIVQWQAVARVESPKVLFYKKIHLHNLACVWLLGIVGNCPWRKMEKWIKEDHFSNSYSELWWLEFRN